VPVGDLRTLWCVTMRAGWYNPPDSLTPLAGRPQSDGMVKAGGADGRGRWSAQSRHLILTVTEAVSGGAAWPVTASVPVAVALSVIEIDPLPTLLIVSVHV
jgi:hypothetical protein